MVFCTQTLRETKVEDVNSSHITFDRQKCPSCNSIGLENGFVSKDKETNTSFLSSQFPVIPETVAVLKIAATRSLSCELQQNNKNGGFVFFGDTAGHILSHTFQLADSNARGFFKLYSIIILMKDKTFLLNAEPFLSQQMEAISKELQEYANTVYKKEQTQCSQRAQRLTTGQITSNTARSLMELTGEVHIYGILHSHFSWLLWAGARYLSESITLGSPSIPPWLGSEIEEGFTMVHIDKEDYLMKKLGKLSTNDNQVVPLPAKRLKEELNDLFDTACYCVLTGVPIIIIRCDSTGNFYARCIAKSFQLFLPELLHNLIRLEDGNYDSQYKIQVLSMTRTVPEGSILIIELNSEGCRVKFSNAVLPNKSKYDNDHVNYVSNHCARLLRNLREFSKWKMGSCLGT